MFTECDFSGANLAESRHRGSAFRNCTFQRASWTTASLAGARVDVDQAVRFALAHGLRLDG